MAPIPYVVGQWVRGDRFYGRHAQIDEILDGHRNSNWLLGTRRIGKTSLLKQIEFIAAAETKPRYFPVFWDFQGAEAPAELHANFAEALLDADERLEQIGIRLDEVEADDLFVSLGRLRRRLRSENLRLLLLCDEVEELIELHDRDPSLLRKLRHVLQSRDDIRSVLASTIRLWALADEQADTSPFLHGFTPPLYIERLSDDEARSLILQTHLRVEDRPDVPRDVADAILGRCDNHPYLVQLVGKRYLETGRLEEAIDQVATDRMVSYFFSVDFGMLSEAERESIRLIAAGSAAAGDSLRGRLPLSADTIEGGLRRLENLGFIRRHAQDGFVLGNYFFRRWLNDAGAPGEMEAPTIESVAGKAVAAGPAARDDGPDGPPADGGLFAEIKRRNVFRVGLAYVAAAWVLLQVSDILFNFLEVPAWAGKLLLALLALGLPIALVGAWAFELTPGGIKSQAEADRSRGTRRPSGRRLDFIIIAVLAIAVVLLVLDKFF